MGKGEGSLQEKEKVMHFKGTIQNTKVFYITKPVEGRVPFMLSENNSI
jgi:hypothetical protein